MKNLTLLFLLAVTAITAHAQQTAETQLTAMSRDPRLTFPADSAVRLTTDMLDARMPVARIALTITESGEILCNECEGLKPGAVIGHLSIQARSEMFPDSLVHVRISASEVRTMTLKEAVCEMETTTDMALRQNIIHALGLPGNPVKDCDKVRCKE